MAAPTGTTDVANKGYVDTQIAFEPMSLALDITGFVSPNVPGVGDGPINDVKAVIESVYPASAAANGKVAKIHCTSYAASTISGIQITVSTSPNATGVLQKSTISVDSAGTQNESVIQDIAFINPATGTVALDPSRFTMTFTITAGVWTWNSTIAYP